MPRNAQPGPERPEVHQITNAVTPHSDDLDARMAKYLVSMLIRTVCVVLVLVVHHPVRWVFAVGAVALPYVAVIIANNTGGRRSRRVALGTPDARTGALGAAPSTATRDGEPPVVLTGVVQPRREDPADGTRPGDGPRTGHGDAA